VKIYGDIYSGNCYKLKLACALLSIPHDWIAIDILKGESISESFREKNPAGKIPVLETDDGDFISESNAILYYLSRDSKLWPNDKLAQAKVLQWQSFEQYSHEPNIAVARFIVKYLNSPESRAEEYHSKMKPGYRALDVMEKTLCQQPFLVGETVSIADISLYAYTHVAHEGGFDLSGYPGINTWLARIRELPDYLSMDG